MADVESYDDGPGRLPNKAHKLLFGNEENVQEMIRKGSIVEEEKVSTTNSMKKAFRSSMAKSFRRTKRATSTASTMTSATRSSYESGDSNWTNPLRTPGTANFSSFSTRQSIVSPITPSSRKESNVGFNHHHHPPPPNFIDPFTQQPITNSPDPIISNSNNRQTRKFSSITPEPNLLEILTSTGNGGSTTSVNSISSKRNAPPPSAYRTRLASVPIESNRMNEKSNRSSNTAYRQSSMMTQQPLLPQQQELQQQQVPDTATLQQPLLRPLLLAQQYQSKENKETNLKGEKGLDDNPPLPPPKKDDSLDENHSSSKGFATRKPWERPLRVPPRLDLSDLSNISNSLMISALGNNNNQQQTQSIQSPKSLTFSQSQKGKMTQDLGGLDSPTVPEESVRDSLLPYMKNGSYNSSIESKTPFSPLSVIRSSSIKNFIAPLSPSSKNKFSTEKSLRDEIERGSITVSHPIHLSNNHGTNDIINDEKIENQLFPGSPNDADSILDGECPSPLGSSRSPSLIENSERLSDLFPIPHKRSSQTDSNGKSTSKHSPSLETVESESEHSQEQEEGEDDDDECFMFDKEIQEEQNQQIIISPPPTITRNGERMSIELIENIISPLPPNPHPPQSSSQSSILSLSNDYESAKSFIREDSSGSGSNRSSNTTHSSGSNPTNNSLGINQNESLRKVRSGSLSTMERPSFTSTPLPPPPTNTFIEENKKQNRILGIRDSKVPMNVNNINSPTPNKNRFSKSIMNQQSIKNLTSLRNLSVPSPSTSCQSSSDIELGKLIGLPGISTNNSKSSLSKNTTKEFENDENNSNGNSLFSSLTTKRSFFSSKPKRKSNAGLNGGNTPMTASSLTSKLIDQSTLSMNHNSASNNTKTRKRRSTITASIPPSPFTVPVGKSRWKNNRPESIDLTLGDDEEEMQEGEVEANTNALTDEVLISDLVDNIIGGMENGGIKSIDNISHSQSLPPSTEEKNQEDEMENLSGDPMASHFSYDSDLDHPTMNGGGNNNHSSSSSSTTGGTSIRKPLKGLLRSVKSVAAFNE